MNMNGRCRSAHGTQNIKIGIAVIIRMDAALKAHLGRTARNSFSGAVPHLGEVKLVGWPTRCLAAAFGKGAKAAFIEADICVVDVAVDDVADDVSDRFAPDSVGRVDDQADIGTVCLEQAGDVPFVEPTTIDRACYHTPQPG